MRICLQPLCSYTLLVLTQNFRVSYLRYQLSRGWEHRLAERKSASLLRSCRYKYLPIYIYDQHRIDHICVYAETEKTCEFADNIYILMDMAENETSYSKCGYYISIRTNVMRGSRGHMIYFSHHIHTDDISLTIHQNIVFDG